MIEEQTSPYFSSYNFRNELILLAQVTDEILALREENTFLTKEIAIHIKSSKNKLGSLTRRKERNYVTRFQLGDYPGPLANISSDIRKDLINEGIPKEDLANVSRFLQPEHRRKYEQSDISDSDFSELEESVFDQTEEMSQRNLSDPQLDKLSDAQVTEVLSQEVSQRKSRKTIDNDRIKHLQDYAQKREIPLVEKVTKQRPPEVYAGQTETWELLGDLEREHDILSKMFKDLKGQVYEFKPNDVVDRKALHELETHVENAFVPYSKVAINWCKGIETIMRNITDEKYSETNRGWMQMAEDKFLAWGNHGSGEVNAVLTNRVIMKLGYREFKEEDGTLIKVIPVIIKVQIKRETTREEVGDKTIFDPQGVLEVHCPHCEKDFNRPYYPEDMVDFIAGDLFHQAKTVLLANGLSNAIDELANAVIIEPVKDPIVWFKEQIEKGRLDPRADPKDVVIEEGKSEKIKTVDINPNDITELRHTILSNAATRRADKAEHFSKEA